MYSKTILLPLIILTSMMALSSNSLMFMWMMMEISSMAFIFMIILNNLTLSKWESATTYFIIQSIASAILIPFMFISNTNLIMINLLINLILILKLGLAPFHSWVPFMMNNLSWLNCFIMTTLQKIIPLIILTKFSIILLIMLTSFISIFISSVMILKSSSMKKIMGYSSISNSGWIIFVMSSSNLLMLFYLMIYSINTYLLFKMFEILNFNTSSDFNKLNLHISWINKFIMIFALMSMAGLPPFMGFLMKFVTILSFKTFSLILTPLIIMSLINLYSYMCICWNSLFIYQSITKPWILKMKYQNINLNSFIMAVMLMSFWIFAPFSMIHL